MIVVSQPLLLSPSNLSFALSVLIFLKHHFNRIIPSLKLSWWVPLPATYIYADTVAETGPHYQTQPPSFTKETILRQGMRMRKSNEKSLTSHQPISVFLKCGCWQLWGMRQSWCHKGATCKLGCVFRRGKKARIQAFYYLG